MGQITGINGIETVVGVSPVTILVAPELAVAIPVIVGNTGLIADGNGKKILLAGTPIFGNLLTRTAAFIKAAAVAAVKGVYQMQIATAATAGDTIVIEGVTYTAGAVESISTKVFAVGAGAAAQITSLLKMVTCANFDVTGATDHLIFTQKIATLEGAPVISAAQVAETGAVVLANTVTTYPVISDAGAISGLLLYETDVTAGNVNAQCLVQGIVNIDKLESGLVTAADIAALAGRIQFMGG